MEIPQVRWASLEEDAWKSLVNNTGRAPRMEFMRGWILIKDKAQQDAILEAIFRFRASQQAVLASPQPGPQPDAADATAVGRWHAQADAAVVARQDLARMSWHLSQMRADAAPGEHCTRTVAWLDGISTVATNGERGLRRRIADVKRRRKLQRGNTAGNPQEISSGLTSGDPMILDVESDESDDYEADRRARSGLSSSWSRAHIHLGRINGLSSAPPLFIKQDHRGAIVDRVVIKQDKLYRPPSVGYRKSFWDETTTPPLPSEISSMLRLRPLQGSNVIVKLRNWKTKTTDTKTESTMFMEFCGLSNLVTLAERYKSHNPASERRDWIPEPFAWSVFEDLAVAGLLMDKGGLNSRGSQWQSIVHRDLKGTNVFLSEEKKQDRYRFFPTAKVGDFGHSCTISPSESKEIYTGAGTRGFYAPEQIPGKMSVPLSSKTNVWGIGIVMQSLLTSFYGTLTSGGEISDDADPPMAPSTVLRFGPLARQQYSKQLLDLIQECTAYEPMDRPGFPELLATIRQHVVAEDLTGGLRDATVGGPGFDLNLPRNTYAVGLTLQAIPAESNTPLPLAIGNDDRPDPEVTDNMGGPVGPYTS